MAPAPYIALSQEPSEERNRRRSEPAATPKRLLSGDDIGEAAFCGSKSESLRKTRRARTEPARKLRSCLGEMYPRVSGTPIDDRGRWHGTLYGFWPTLVYVMTILTVVFCLNVHWAATGSLGLADLGKLTAVDASMVVPGPVWLLASRAISAIVTVYPVCYCVMEHRKRARELGEELRLGGLEVLLALCTLWTWTWKAGYFTLATVVSTLYVGFGVVPPTIIGDLLWVWFDIVFGMAWLVFWACWIFLIPYCKYHQLEQANQLLSPVMLYLHNFNVVLMMTELVLSQWTLNIEHAIFPVYFGIAYCFFNWWWYSKTGVWIYFFLDYDQPCAMFYKLALVAFIVVAFWFGGCIAALLGKGS